MGQKFDEWIGIDHKLSCGELVIDKNTMKKESWLGKFCAINFVKFTKIFSCQIFMLYGVINIV